MNDPPVPDDGTEEDETEEETQEPKNNLEERFYKYGVKPEFLQISRVLWHRYVNRTFLPAFCSILK